MFIKSFIGACFSAAAVSLRVQHLDQSPATLAELLAQASTGTDSNDTDTTPRCFIDPVFEYD